MRLPPGTQFLRRLPHTYTRDKNPPETQAEGLKPLPRHQSRLRQRQRLHPQSKTLGPPSTLLHGRLGLLLPVRKDVHLSVRGIPQPLLPGFGGHAPRVPHLPPAFSDIRFPPAHVDPQGTYGLLRRRFFNHSSLPNPQRQHLQTTKTLRHGRRKTSGPRRVLLGPKNGAHRLADSEPEVPPIIGPH